MKKTWKRLCTGFLALATVVTALPTTPVHAESKQYWTESKERVGIVEEVMNDGSIGSTFNEGHLTVEGEDAYCIDINTDFKNGYKTRADASTRMSADQISDVALSIEYVKQYTDSHNGISKNHAYLLRQLVVWQRLSVHLGWQCDNVRASYDEIPKATQDEVFAGAKALGHSALVRRVNYLRAERLHQCLLFKAKVLRNHQNCLEAVLSGSQGDPDPGVTGGRFNDRGRVRDRPAGNPVFNQGHPQAVFDRAPRVIHF